MPRIYFPFYRLIGRRRFSPLLKSLTALRSPYTYVTRSSHFERIYMHRLRRIALISPGQRVVYRRYVCIRGSVPEYPRRTELGDARYRNAPTDLSSRTFMLSLCATAAECLSPLTSVWNAVYLFASFTAANKNVLRVPRRRFNDFDFDRGRPGLKVHPDGDKNDKVCNLNAFPCVLRSEWLVGTRIKRGRRLLVGTNILQLIAV